MQEYGPKKYGRYQIGAEIGRGAMGVVYRAFDPQIHREIALKTLHEHRVANEEEVLRFLKEGQAMGELPHPNIVTVYDTGWDHNMIFIAMEFVKGKSLADAMRAKKMKPQEIAQIGVQVAEALDFAHRRKIVHRDIKPSNILIDPNNQVKITDFGIAHIDDAAMTRQTGTGEVLGTPLYMSPEQVEGKDINGCSDLYSLGVILYELATGTTASQGESLHAIYKSILSDKPPAPKLDDTPISRSLSRIIMKSLRKNPRKRFQTGDEMAKALKACVKRRRSDTQPQRTVLGLTKRSVSLILTAVALIITVVIVANILTDKPILSIESDPTEANVFLNGSLKGKTPLKVPLPPGKYEILITRQNYYEWEGQIQLEEHGETPLFVELVSTEKE